MPKCKTEGCRNQAEEGKPLCRECNEKEFLNWKHKEEQAKGRRQAIGHAIISVIGRILSQH